MILKNEKCKILIFLQDFSELGGVEVVTNRLINGLIDDYEITLLSIRNSNEVCNVNYPTEVNKHIISFQSDDDFNIKLNKFLLDNNFKFAINQVQNLRISAILSHLLQEKKIKSFSILHNSPYLYKYGVRDVNNNFIYFLKKIKRRTIGWFSNKKYLNIILKNSTKFVCISENCYSEFYKLGFKMDKVIMIYNPFDPSFVDHRIDNKKENVFVYAGRFSPEKNLLELLNVWNELESKTKNWELVLIGDGSEKYRLLDFVENKNLYNVKILNKSNDIRDIISKSKVAILNSSTEGLPTFLIEAGVYRNVLFGKISFGGTQDIILENINGYIYKNKIHLKNMIESYIENEDNFPKVTNLKVYEKFFEKEIIKKWKDLLKEL
ncbi:glycosyltransferase [Empedobacter sp.]|uniref:glycosyltransferase n=1 Tax=Empedobacter sp. TaxID=1927715 RepID=UPI00289671DE|nr:glycosyltransferase [Empedobacter sp.]